MKLKEKVLIYEVSYLRQKLGYSAYFSGEEFDTDELTDRFKDKEIDTTYVCNACGGSGHSGARTKL